MKFIVFLLIVFLIVYGYFYFKSHNVLDSTIISFTGGNGKGKSFNSTNKSRDLYLLSYSHWFKINKSLIYRHVFRKKCQKNEYYNKPAPRLYSNTPIVINKRLFKKYHNKYSAQELYERRIISYPAFLSLLDNCYQDNEEVMPLGSIVHMDEIKLFMDQFITKALRGSNYDQEIDNISDNLTLWRHYHGNDSHFVCNTQCSKEINSVIRYKLNKAYSCESISHILGIFHITKYRIIDLTDDIKSIDMTSSDNKDLHDKYCTLFKFGRFRIYDDRAHSERFREIDGYARSLSKLKSEMLVKFDGNRTYNNILRNLDHKK